MYAVAVTITLKPGTMERFMPLMRDNAAASLRNEPGCRQFDLCTDDDQPDTVFLYEIYQSPEAFQSHLDSAHYKAFDAETSEMLAGKQVSTWREVQQ